MTRLLILGGGFAGVMAALNAADENSRHGSDIAITLVMRKRIAAHADEAVSRAARIVLVEQASVLAPEFGEEARPVIERALAEAGVEIRLSIRVVKVDPDAMIFDGGERLTCSTTVLATCLHASPLTAQIPRRRDQFGRLHVDNNCGSSTTGPRRKSAKDGPMRN